MFGELILTKIQKTLLFDNICVNNDVIKVQICHLCHIHAVGMIEYIFCSMIPMLKQDIVYEILELLIKCYSFNSPVFLFFLIFLNTHTFINPLEYLPSFRLKSTLFLIFVTNGVKKNPMILIDLIQYSQALIIFILISMV